MPPFVLFVFVIITATLLTQVFVLTPLEFIRHLSLPNWLILAVLVVVLSWGIGE